MRKVYKKIIVLCLTMSMSICLAGCGGTEKEPKPEPKTTAKIDDGNADAKGKGDGQSDIPLVIGTGKFEKKFNPFIAKSDADKQVVKLTQAMLFGSDRAGKLVYKGIDGELRTYKDENYTYYGASNLSIKYDKEKNITSYKISIRDDLSFSDGEKLNINDVIFSLYVFLDKSYSGENNLKNMPIVGLTNYYADSDKAEKYPENKLKKLYKKNSKKFKKWITKKKQYKNTKITSYKTIRENYDLEREFKIFVSKGKGNKVNSISGIKKLDDYSLEISTYGYNRKMSQALQIPICALHYYGDSSKYDGISKFGFRKGDISSVTANKSTPVGAGPYRFIKIEDSVVYFNSNELYYLGCPDVAFLQLKDMSDILTETQKTIDQKIAVATTEPESTGEEETNPSAHVTEIVQGTVDVLTSVFQGEEITNISRENSNEELSGDKLSTQFVSTGKYQYIGINAVNVSVGKNALSEESKRLRKAFAELIGTTKRELKVEAKNAVELVEQPCFAESWINSEIEEDKKSSSAAQKSALKYFESAGYTVSDGKVIKAPEGAKLAYEISVLKNDNIYVKKMIEKTAEALGNIGITLNVREYATEKELDKKMKSDSLELWAGVRNIDDDNLSERYSSLAPKNYFDLKDSELDSEIEKIDQFMKNDERKEQYNLCYTKLMEDGVEIPVWEYKKAVLFSSARIKSDSIPQNITAYYDFVDSIQKFEMK